MKNCILVGMGGFLGAVLRYGLTLLPWQEKSSFPFITLFINILGAFIIGVLSALAIRQHPINADWLLFLKVGVCGGFTTFSTFALEASHLMNDGKLPIALLYATTSVIGCILAVMLGQKLIELF